MDEIIIVDMSVFLDLRPSPPSLLTSEKITSILSLDCFNESSAKFTTHTFKSKPIQQFQRANPIAQRPQIVKAISYHDKMIREITGIINKINASNSSQIVKKIERLIDANNVALISDIILEKSTIHTSYMFELVKLLEVMSERYSPIVFSSVSTFINNFTVNLHNKFTWLMDLDYENYDEYCTFILQKKILLNKVALVLHLSNGQWDQSVSLFSEILQHFNTFRHNPQLQTLILEMLSVFFQKDYSVYADAMTLAIEVNNVDDLTSKSKFLFQDIMELAKKNHI